MIGLSNSQSGRKTGPCQKRCWSEDTKAMTVPWASKNTMKSSNLKNRSRCGQRIITSSGTSSMFLLHLGLHLRKPRTWTSRFVTMCCLCSTIDSGLGELEIGGKCNQSVRCRATHACQYDNEFTRVASDSFVIWSRIDSLAARVNRFWTRYVCTWVWRLLFILINTGRGHLCVLAASAERF